MMELSRLVELLSAHERGKKRPRFQTATVPAAWLTILPQPRQTFDAEPLQALADDLADKGLMNPVTVARYTQREAALEHLQLVADARQRKIDPGLLRPVRGEGFFILIAGERRTRAHRQWWEAGCTLCAERAKQATPGDCFRHHTGLKTKELVVEARVMTDANPLSTLFQQLSENTHVSVPPHEEANAYSDLYRLLRRAQPRLTQKGFAARVGRSVRVIAHALRFAELPDGVQRFVLKGALPYLAAVEVSQLVTLYDAPRLLAVAEYVVSKGFRLPDVKVYVRTLLQQAQQPSLLGEMQLTSEQIQAAAQRAQLRQALTGLSQVQTCLRRARLVQDLVPARRSVRLLRVFRRQTEALRQLLAMPFDQVDRFERSELQLIKKALMQAIEELHHELEEVLSFEQKAEVKFLLRQLEPLGSLERIGPRAA